VKKIHPELNTAWMGGKVIFKDTPMPEVLRKLAHFYSVDFDMKDSVIRKYSFTGTFDHKPLFQILDYMKISSNISYEMTYPQNLEVRNPVIILGKLRSKTTKSKNN
jgi:ferric-dicitrate binding protein FerR (iron transport regulator)